MDCMSTSDSAFSDQLAIQKKFKPFGELVHKFEAGQLLDSFLRITSKYWMKILTSFLISES